MSQLSFKDVSLGYDGREVLHGVSFDVRHGDYLCILGENGSGKTTLIKTILGLKNPVCGVVTFGDGLLPDEIGYLPQQSTARRDFPATVGEIVLSGTLNRCKKPFYGKVEKAMAKRNLERLGINDLVKRSYRELSGGQQQRVLLARALCAAHKLLLLDEPTAGLDPSVTADMYSLIESLNKDDGMTVIMITHDISAALKYSTHILHLGKEVFFCTRDEYVKRTGGGL